ncbi:hypothetical protein KY289_036765 [Solanum tuberosum]|nr:hypothetical protein KY284_036582 [Solanum tuberosum]KAH0636850.1 hypothetical protein KY289_036765 [Solanum tuberosum]
MKEDYLSNRARTSSCRNTKQQQLLMYKIRLELVQGSYWRATKEESSTSPHFRIGFSSCF